PAIEGEVIAGGVLPKGRDFTHPATLAADLERAGAPWPINGMSWTTYRHRPDAFLDEVGTVTRARIKAMERMADSDWDLGFLQFSASQAVFGPMQWGWARKVARKAYDVLGLHGKVSLPQSVNWAR